MSAFKLIEIIKTSERESQSIYDKEILDEAVIAMHNDFGVAVKQDTTIGAYAVIVDNTTGARIDGAQWGEPVKDRVYTHNDVTEDNISSYESEQLAIGNYHTKLAAQRNNANVTHAITLRLSGTGEFVDFDSWTKPIAPADSEE